MSIRAGRLSRKVQIFTVTETPDAAGQPVKTLSSKGYAWANVTSLRGDELMRHGRENLAKLVLKFTIRYLGALSVKDQILYNGYYHDILTVSPYGAMNRCLIDVLAEAIDIDTVLKK